MAIESKWERFLNFLSGSKVHENSPPPYLLKYRSSKAFIITTVCIAVFTDIFLYGIIVPVIPYSLSERVNVPESSVQHWVSVLLAVYGAALCAGAPLVGYYADQTSSRRLPLLLGLVALSAATILLCLARTIAVLVVGRILQGLSAAVVWTVGQALLVDTVGEKEIGQTAGWVSISMSMAILIAPLLGGLVYNRVGYYPVYYMAFGLIALDIILRLILVEKKIAKQWEGENFLQRTSVAARGEKVNTTRRTFAGQEAGDLESPNEGNQAIEISEPGVINEVQALPADASKLPPIFHLIRSKRLLAALWGTIVQGSLMTAFDAVLPLFVQSTFHWDSTSAGLIFLALYIPNFVAPAVGSLSDRFGPRWPVFSGFMLGVLPLICLRFVTHESMKQKILLCALLTLLGTTLTMVMVPLMAEITYVVEAKEKKNPGIYGSAGAYGQAYALFIMAFAAGTLIGPLWAGFVNEKAGWATMAWSLGIFSASGAGPALFFTGGYIMSKNAKTGKERSKHSALDVASTSETNVIV